MRIEELLEDFSQAGMERSFRLEGKAYRVFAYPSLGKAGPCVRWNLYEETKREPLRGLTFGIATGVREALEEVLASAQEHASTGRVRPESEVLSFRPPPAD